MYPIESIGPRIRGERERLGLTQDEVAAAALAAGAKGTTRQSQSRYEKGERVPGTDYLAAVAELGFDIDFIVTGKRREVRGSPPGRTEPNGVVNPYEPVQPSPLVLHCEEPDIEREYQVVPRYAARVSAGRGGIENGEDPAGAIAFEVG